MAFVWSRLALAAVLAAGAACAPAEAGPAKTATPCNADECDGPRLVCSEGASFVVFGDGLDDAIADDAAGVAAMPRLAVAITGERGYEAPAARGDVLVVAPKTSPPRT